MKPKARAKPRLRGALAAARGLLPLPRSSSSNSAASGASAARAMSDASGEPPARAAEAADPPRGGLLFESAADRALADRQKTALRFVVARLGGQLLSGNISLKSHAMPVHLNEPRSFLQRLTDELVFAHALIDQAAGCVGAGEVCGLGALGATSEPARRLALVAAYLVAGLQPSASMAKAYNPQIGETFAADFGPASSTTRIYLEQTRHHPPVSHFTATPSSGAYRLSGYTSFDSQFRMAESAVYTRRTGVTVIDFGGDPEDRIAFVYPTVVVRGIIAGERRVDVIGPCSLYYKKYNLAMDLLFDPLGVAGQAGQSPVAAVAAMIPSFGFFSGTSVVRSPSGIAADARDSVGDAVRGVIYEVLPDSETRFSDAYDAASADGEEKSAFFGCPEEVAELHKSIGKNSKSDYKSLELRSDKDTAESVLKAWAGDVDEDCVAPEHGPEASPDAISRRILALATGSWLSHFDVAGTRVWDQSTQRHTVRPVPLDESLPSDSRRREDIIALERALSKDQANDKAIDAAQEIKEKLENVMRAESKVRPVPELVSDPFFPNVHLGVVPK